jgi:hypothetical protein
MYLVMEGIVLDAEVRFKNVNHEVGRGFSTSCEVFDELRHVIVK